MLTVNGDGAVVERQLAGGDLLCLSCGGVLARWGHGRPRRVRVWGGAERGCVPRRARCRGCRADSCAASGVVPGPAGRCRRGDRAGAGGEGGRVRAPGDRGAAGPPGVDGAGLAAGAGPRAERVRAGFTALAAVLVTDPPLPAPAGSPLADAVAAVAAAAAAAAGCRGWAWWRGGSWRPAVTCGLLLAPAWPARVANTSWLWAAAR